jgi:hypothetical protein
MSEQNTTEQAGSEQQTPPTAADKKPGAEQSADKLFTQAELDRIISDRLEREEKKRKSAEEKARKDAEEASLKEREDWQKLAAKREAELAEAGQKLAALDDLQAKHDAAVSALVKLLERERKDLPKHILSLLDQLDPVAQLEWLAANKAEAAAKPASPAGTPQPRPRTQAGAPAPNSAQPSTVRF